jgi:competence ComEA-like helix-hairpin-helix protein
MHLSKTLFFAIDNLHIQLSERYFILSLTIIYLSISLINPFLSVAEPYDEEYYQPLMELFFQHNAENYLERRSVLERYYPGDEEKIEYYSQKIIPLPFKNEVLTKVSEIEIPKSEIKGPQLIRDTGIVLQENQSIARADSTQTRININTADVSGLTKLPGIGKSIAERIIQHRNENGSFKRIEDIMNVRGIGVGRFNAFKHMLEV